VVTEDQVLVEMMTDKAAVEIPSPVSGTVVSMHGEAGDMVPVGTEFIVFETAASAPAEAAPEAETPVAEPAQAAVSPPPAAPAKPVSGGPVLTSPAIRRMAKESGIDLSQVAGTGPRGRITRDDLEAFAAGHRRAPALRMAAPRTGVEEIKVVGVRRVIARRMSDAKRNIPHFAYVEEVDVTELESLRVHMNSRLKPGQAGLTYLPFLALALAKVIKTYPQCNAHYEEERGVILRHQGIHIGVATQTADGLKVPVVKHVEARSLWDLSEEMRRVTAAARDGKASREELTGSTITITSLGKLGGIVSTPIINAPEVAIIGVNKALERPVVMSGAITVRRIMNLSSSFDHRFVDGYDAAAMIQDMKELLEHPATIFVD
jgi:2-oxoisovalerate dehydrogenase E2 component (dihydrolipoyl transacylase)